MDRFGKNFILSDSGGTHDDKICGKIIGCPKGVAIDFDFIRTEMKRRAPSTDALSSKRREPDEVTFLSGIEEGLSTGEEIRFEIPNRDVKINPETVNVIKPSHASYTYKMKYGIADNSGTGRASARQTACRVVAGAIAKLILKKVGITIHAQTESIAPIRPQDTSGARVHCTISGAPAGLGEPIYDKFDARLAYAMLSINAAKGFEIGKGFEAANMNGSEYNDLQNPDFSFQTNNDGGVQAGISNGQDIYFSVAFKPIPTLQKAQKTIDFQGNPAIYKGNNRNDISVVPRVLPVVEAMAALVTLDFLLESEKIKENQNPKIKI